MLLVDARGVPLSIIVTAANHHDITQLVPLLDAVVVPRPEVAPRARQHLCADAGFRGASARQDMLKRQYTPHVRPGSRSGPFLVHALPQTAGPLRKDASILSRAHHARRCHHQLPAGAREDKYYLRINS